MKFTFESSKKGNVGEALRNITEPAALLFLLQVKRCLSVLQLKLRRCFQESHLLEGWAGIYGQTVF